MGRINAAKYVPCPHCDKGSMRKVNITYRNHGRTEVIVYRCKECGKHCNKDKIRENVNGNQIVNSA